MCILFINLYNLCVKNYLITYSYKYAYEKIDKAVFFLI